MVSGAENGSENDGIIEIRTVNKNFQNQQNFEEFDENKSESRVVLDIDFKYSKESYMQFKQYPLRIDRLQNLVSPKTGRKDISSHKNNETGESMKMRINIPSRKSPASSGMYSRNQNITLNNCAQAYKKQFGDLTQSKGLKKTLETIVSEPEAPTPYNTRGEDANDQIAEVVVLDESQVLVSS